MMFMVPRRNLIWNISGDRLNLPHKFITAAGVVLSKENKARYKDLIELL